ncbi:hypothetical protein HMPREF9163_01342 [Selenomonas sp. oral taxon 138 str. F0429]|nr:hypothetical protein HMPREF9163_01342 [Selenomonas sp. oral taxon 138 str. F0429]
MRPVCLLVRTKNLRQSDGLHFISDSLVFGRNEICGYMVAEEGNWI